MEIHFVLFGRVGDIPGAILALASYFFIFRENGI